MRRVKLCLFFLLLAAPSLGGSLAHLLAQPEMVIHGGSIENAPIYDDNRDNPGHWVPTIARPQIYWPQNPGKPDNIAASILIQSEIGSGTFSTVYWAKDLERGDKAVVKVLSKDFYFKYSRRMEVENELLVLAALPKNDPNICGYRRFLQDDRFIYQVLDYCEGTTLTKQLSARSEKEARPLVKKILEALIHLHSLHFYHMDFNDSNMLVHEGRIRILDFGRTIMHNVRRHYNAGAYGFHTPERLLSKESLPSLFDTWYMGVLIFRVVYNDFPFGFKLNADYTKKALSGKVKYPTPPSPELADLLSKIFVKEKKRITLNEIAKHPWMMAD